MATQMKHLNIFYIIALIYKYLQSFIVLLVTVPVDWM